MDINVDRDAGDHTLIRGGTFRISSTSGIVPFKVRRLTGIPSCEAKALRDDDRVHINELYRPIQRNEIGLLTGKKNDQKEALIENLGEMMGGMGSDINMLHLALPRRRTYSKEMMDGVADILYFTKNNKLILPPFTSDERLLRHKDYLLKALKDRGQIGPGREMIGLIPARIDNTMSDVMIKDYLDLNVNVFVIDAAGGNIPEGMLGKVNAKLEKAKEGKYLLMVLGQPEVLREERGQTVTANDVVAMPCGYDGYAPNRRGFGKDDKDAPKDKAERKRWMELRMKDKKGKKRLFVPDSWGRVQFGAVITDEPEMISSSRASQFCTRTSSKNDIIDLYNDDAVEDELFNTVLRCHDTELVEMELEDVGQAAIEGLVMDTIKERDYAVGKIDRMEAEKNAFKLALKEDGAQKKLF